MEVGDVMKREVRTLSVDATAREAFEIMKEGRFRHIPVVSEGRLRGILSERDLRLVMTVADAEEELGVHHIPENITVGEIMTEQPAILVPSSDVQQAVSLMVKHKIGALPVVEKGDLVGIVTQTDMLELLLEFLGERTQGSVGTT